ncbi:MAG: hypothetical protein JWM80_6279 [Cyanobacteria bacterium RYN_339]|nr:hypothetical protein [Cyanobacteria bacterium RYN_339]
MTTPIDLTVRFLAKPGQEEALAQALAVLVPPTRAEDGCLRFEAVRGTEAPAQFLLIERWAGQAPLAAHGSQPHLQAFVAQHPALLAAPPEAVFWQPL